MRTLCQAVFAFVCICGVTSSSASVLRAEEANKAVEKSAEKKKEMTKEELFSKANVQKLSESLGHFIYKSLDNPLMKLDYEAVIKGLKDAKSGKTAPMTEQEYEEMLQKIQEISFEEMSKTNLQEANQFLEKNKSKKNILSLEDGKLQYEIVQPGKGDELVTEKSSVSIHYDGKYLNGKSFGSSVEGQEPITIVLTQTIPGFKKGMLGMKVGEKRRLYIHPDLGYGTCGQLLPNALLVFDVEVLKIEEAPVAEETEEENTDTSSLDDESTDDDQDFEDEEDSVKEQPKK